MAKKVVFNVFPCSAKGWCACRADGLVCGYFVDQAGAVRFARRETCGKGVIAIRGVLAADVPLVLAA
jgi:hypothetical protein